MSQGKGKRTDSERGFDTEVQPEESLIAVKIRDNRRSLLPKTRLVKASRNTILGSISSTKEDSSHRALVTSTSNAHMKPYGLNELEQLHAEARLELVKRQHNFHQRVTKSMLSDYGTEPADEKSSFKNMRRSNLF